MSELIKINYDVDRQTTSARTLWEFLDKPYEKFTKWFGQYKQYGFIENQDFRAMCIKFHTAQGNESEEELIPCPAKNKLRKSCRWNNCGYI